MCLQMSVTARSGCCCGRNPALLSEKAVEPAAGGHTFQPVQPIHQNMPVLPGHQRNISQGQNLIVDRDEDEDLERCTASPTRSQGIYPGGSPPPIYEPGRPQENKAKGLCSDPQIRANLKVILGSVALTVAGTVILILGVMELIKTEGANGYVFLFAGFLFFVPGFYHVYYTLCTLCGRPGYAFDKLPTFNR